MSLFIDHDVLRFQVAVHDPELVGLGQPLADLLGDVNCFPGAQRPYPPERAFQVFARNILHGDVGHPLGFAQVKHAADILVSDLSGKFQFIPETLDDFVIGRDLGFEELQSHFLPEFLIEDLIDIAHSAFTQFFDDLVPVGKCASDGQFFQGLMDGFGLGKGEELCSTRVAEPASLRVFTLAAGAFHIQRFLCLRGTRITITK